MRQVRIDDDVNGSKSNAARVTTLMVVKQYCNSLSDVNYVPFQNLVALASLSEFWFE